MKQLTFGDIVVVEGYLIGVIVKSWVKNNEAQYHEVYVRDTMTIKEYNEKDIDRYMVRHKELSEEEMEWQDNAVHPFVDIHGRDKELYEKMQKIFNDPNYEKNFQEWKEKQHEG